jgi:outer membrane biosynthesis protein TonB
MADRPNSDFDQRYRRALRWGLVLSVTVHALLFIVFDGSTLPVSPFAAAGERRGDFRAVQGGGVEAMEAIMLRSPDEVPAPPEPVPEPDAVVVEPEPQAPPEEEMSLPTVEVADVLAAPSPGTLDAPGLARGEGEGDGGTELEGRFRVLPPRPRGLILPPGDRPADVRGKEVEVWVFVTAQGQVVPDSTRLNPPTGHRGFDRRLREHAAGWVFEAARKGGRPVAEWFRYTVIM